MIEPATGRNSSGFDALLHTQPDREGTVDTDAAPASGRAHPWALPTATAMLAVLGIGALTASMLLPTTTPATPQHAATSTTQPSPSRTPIRVPTAGTAGTTPAPMHAEDTPISELADPTWVTRIAAAGNIPERALAAYAGAALATARTHPGCGIGWNTLAAIGLVETEHGSMNNAKLDPDGTVSPAIIGIPLNGDGTNVVHDTDQGRIDGDAQWDRAVGPMQFIPSTWSTAQQDGNRDGRSDINQIDDAALATATHLCDVGTNLTIAESWIIAINAYNPSIEYNNRVAEAANHYATLR